MGILLSWIILSLAVWLTAVLLPGVHLKDFWSAFVVSALFGILNFFLGWIFFTLFTILTLGVAFILAFITRWVINAIILKIVAALTDRLEIDGFGWALLAALVMSGLGTLGQWLLVGAV